MRRALLIFTLLATALVGAATARGELSQVGNLRLAFDGGFAPHALPRDRDVPVTVSMEGSVRTTDGTTPPQLRSMSIAVNRHGKITTDGLPICRPSRLEATSSDAALARCRSALVGHGRFGVNVNFPNIEFPVEGRMLAFNSRAGGRPAIAVHVHGSNPVEATVVLIFHISHPRGGRYGTVLSTRIPKIASDLGYVTDISLSFGRRYRHEGEARSFISARCAAPAGFPAVPFLFAKGSFDFADGRTISSQLSRACRVAS